MPEKEKDNSLPQALSVAVAVIAIIGAVYNLAWFWMSDLSFVMLLDYTDFIYTPIYLLMPCLSASLLVLALHTLWRSSPWASAIDAGLSVAVVGLAVLLSVAEEREVTFLLGAYAELVTRLLIILSLGICFIWIWMGAMTFPEISRGAVLGSLGFMISAGLYAARVAQGDLISKEFGDRLIVKERKSIADIHIARITGKGVFFVARNRPGNLSFYKSDAYEGIERRTK